jgi:hypothetical protein
VDFATANSGDQTRDLVTAMCRASHSGSAPRGIANTTLLERMISWKQIIQFKKGRAYSSDWIPEASSDEGDKAECDVAGYDEAVASPNYCTDAVPFVLDAVTLLVFCMNPWTKTMMNFRLKLMHGLKIG